MRETTATAVTWPLVLAGAAIGGTLATACMMPFVGVAALAAATMPRAQAVITVVGVWAANQLLGFGVLGYPWTAYAATWGLALGAASVAALFVARRVLAARPPSLARLAGAFGVAFLAYEALLLVVALVVGGTETFTPAIVLRILANEAAWFGGLGLLYAALIRAAPAVFGRATPARAG